MPNYNIFFNKNYGTNLVDINSNININYEESDLDSIVLKNTNIDIDNSSENNNFENNLEFLNLLFHQALLVKFFYSNGNALKFYDLFL